MSFHHATSARIARFGRGAVILRGREAALDADTLRSAAPTLFAEGKHSSRSERYAHIPTFEVLAGLEREGFRPYEVRVGGSSDLDKRNHTKHLIRLRKDGLDARRGRVPEVVLINAHDGTSRYKLMYGVFIMVCSNGTIVSDGEMTELSIPHKGDVINRVIEGTYQVIGESRRIEDHVQQMEAVQLTHSEQRAFAESAAMLRWAPDAETGTSNVPATIQARPEAILIPRRHADNTPSLWNVFNRAQENLINGGVSYTDTNARGRLVHRTARAVNGIDGNVGLNRALWHLAARMAELKQAA